MTDSVSPNSFCSGHSRTCVDTRHSAWLPSVSVVNPVAIDAHRFLLPAHRRPSPNMIISLCPTTVITSCIMASALSSVASHHVVWIAVTLSFHNDTAFCGSGRECVFVRCSMFVFVVKGKNLFFISFYSISFSISTVWRSRRAFASFVENIKH